MMTMTTSIRLANSPIIAYLLTLYHGTGSRFSRRHGDEFGIFKRSILARFMSAVSRSTTPREGVSDEAGGKARLLAHAAEVCQARPAPGGPDA